MTLENAAEELAVHLTGGITPYLADHGTKTVIAHKADGLYIVVMDIHTSVGVLILLLLFYRIRCSYLTLPGCCRTQTPS